MCREMSRSLRQNRDPGNSQAGRSPRPRCPTGPAPQSSGRHGPGRTTGTPHTVTLARLHTRTHSPTLTHTTRNYTHTLTHTGAPPLSTDTLPRRDLTLVFRHSVLEGLGTRPRHTNPTTLRGPWRSPRVRTHPGRRTPRVPSPLTRTPGVLRNPFTT